MDFISRKVSIMHWKTVIFAIYLCSVSIGTGLQVQAQDSNLKNTLFLLRQESEERYRKLRAELEDAQAANISLMQRMEALEKENRSLRRDVAKIPTSPVSEDDLKKLSSELIDRIKTVDKRRADDNKALVDQIKELVSAVNKLNTKPVITTVKNDKPRRVPKKIAEVTVEPNYTISAIAEAYRLEGIDVTVAEILEANPQISDPRKIKIGDV
ncbi:MAG: LysM peptidoglycan-binding domain-containing protein, partial [Verrucomicrobia bacterium]|nr:LysM peptidoglycan-binding domain-containing protein [Verrucomicrobiota bacterium]